MQILIVSLIVASCAIFWLNRLFPKIGKLIWQGVAFILKLTHAPSNTQAWALRHCIVATNACSACDKCNKCH